MQRWRRKLGVVLLTVLAAYVAAPYVTLYRLADSIRRGDAQALEALVDWDGVREGIKEDICDTVFDMPSASASATETLPPFGYSFVRGIAANAIDEAVTPAALVTATSRYEVVSSAGVTQASAGTSAAAPQPRIAWAFFDGPRVFRVELVPPAEAGLGHDPVRLQLELGGSGWKVTRAWLPPVMLTQANPRT